MKSICLQIFEIPDRSSEIIDRNRYSVFLFWERRVKFTDRKKMLKFLSGASKELTYTVTEIIHVSKDLFRIGSDAFILIDSWDAKELDYFIGVFKNINSATNFSGPNSHSYIFKSIYDALSELEYISKKLITLYKGRNQFLQIRELEIILNRINGIKERVDRIGSS